MPSSADDSTVRKRRSRVRLMAPLIVWLCSSALLLSWTWFESALERTTLVFQVAVDEGPPAEELSVKLDGRSFQSGAQVSLGSHTLLISGPTVEPCRKKASVWLGRNDWGRIDLKRIKGILDAQTEPAAKELLIAGALFSATETDAAEFSRSVPIGEYEVTAVFLHTRERREAEVLRNETCRCAIAPPFGALDLASDPKGVEYSLRSPTAASLSFSGTAPAELIQLPAGAYDLSMQWAGSGKDRQLKIAAQDQPPGHRFSIRHGAPHDHASGRGDFLRLERPRRDAPDAPCKAGEV